MCPLLTVQFVFTINRTLNDFSDNVMMNSSNIKMNVFMAVYILTMVILGNHSPGGVEDAFGLMIVGVEYLFSKTERFESCIPIILRFIDRNSLLPTFDGKLVILAFVCFILGISVGISKIDTMTHDNMTILDIEIFLFIVYILITCLSIEKYKKQSIGAHPLE